VFHEVKRNDQVTADGLHGNKIKAIGGCDGAQAEGGVSQAVADRQGALRMVGNQIIITFDGLGAHACPGKVLIQQDAQCRPLFPVDKPKSGSGQVDHAPDGMGVARCHHKAFLEERKRQHNGIGLLQGVLSEDEVGFSVPGIVQVSSRQVGHS